MTGVWRLLGLGGCSLMVLLGIGDQADLGSDYGCSVSQLASLPSPEGGWRAILNESVCYGGGFAVTVAAAVRVISEHDPSKAADLVAVDTGGSKLQRPRIAWTGPFNLQVTVQNKSFLEVPARSLGPIRLDLRFDPPDPAARARWLRELDARDRGE